jgi:predicted nucleotidyltransferase/predicted transcriptional regulator
MGRTVSTFQLRAKAAAKPHSSVNRKPRGSMVDALFSATQRRVLGLLFGQPERSFFATEIIARVGAGSGAVQRELKKLSDSGLATVSQQGNQKHYQANSAAPIYAELCTLIKKTVGMADPIRNALEPKRKAIELALIYGSVAKQQETASSDIDVLLVSDTLTLETVYGMLRSTEQSLGRTINPTLYTLAEFNKRRSSGNAFLKRVLAGEKIMLFGALVE